MNESINPLRSQRLFWLQTICSIFKKTSDYNQWNGTGVENRSQISDFFTPWKNLGEEWAKYLSLYFKFSLAQSSGIILMGRCFAIWEIWSSLFTIMVETHKRKRKNTVITKITLTISDAEHIKQTLSTNRLYRHQQHLPKISQNVSGAVYGWQFDLEAQLKSSAALHKAFFDYVAGGLVRM